MLLERSKEVLGEFGEYLNNNCQLGMSSPFLNEDLHYFLSEKESIPNQRQYEEMKEMISSGRIDDIEWEKAMEDPMTEEERKLYNEKYPPMTDEEYREEIESVRRDRELGMTEEE